MPTYSYDELEKIVPDPKIQSLLFGDRIETMRLVKPNGKVSLWCKIEDYL